MYSNPILNQGRNNTIQPQTIQQIKNLMSQVKGMQNTESVLQNLIAQNPNLSNILSVARNNGVSLQQVAQVMAQQQGIDLDALIQQLQS